METIIKHNFDISFLKKNLNINVVISKIFSCEDIKSLINLPEYPDDFLRRIT